MKKWKWISLAVLVILMACLGLFLKKHYQEEQRQAAIYEEIDNQLRPLNVKKQRLITQLEKLTEDYEAKRRPKATAQVIFTELDPQVYDLCYPLMRDRSFSGMLALSQAELPGAEGCMTMEQFQKLQDAGWRTCITWNKDSKVEVWLPALKEQLKQLNIDAPTVIYCPKGTYASNLDEKFKSLGFNIVVHHEEAGRALIQTQYEEELWHLGALGLMGSRTKVRFDEAIKQKGNIIYLVGFEKEDELYEERSFTIMLDYFKSYSDDQELVVGSMEDARAHYYSRVEEVSAEEEAQYLQQKTQMEAELADLEAQIDELQWQ